MADQPADHSSPPVEATPPSEPKRSTWPVVIGVIAIVFGSLGTIGGCMGMLTPVYMGMMADQMAQIDNDAMRVQMEVSRRFAGYQAIASIPLFALAVLLLAAGIGLVQRRPWGRTAILTWAVLRMVVAVPIAFMSYVMLRHALAAMAEQGVSVPPGLMMRLFQFLGASSIAVSLLWAWAFPVFCIIWMLRASVKAEVERWGLESRAAI